MKLYLKLMSVLAAFLYMFPLLAGFMQIITFIYMSVQIIW